MVAHLLAVLFLCFFHPADLPAAELTYDLAVVHGRVPDNMRLIRVKQGDVVRLRCTVDEPISLHVHGYDIEQRLMPGAAVEISVTAHATGRFPIHAHPVQRAADAGTHDEALAVLEVYPR